jgi:hypothetical protein
MQSCGKDNLKYPSSTLKGRFTYQGQPVPLMYNNLDVFDLNNNANTWIFQQTKGPQNVYGVGNIRVYAKHDGSFSSKFFDGEYLARTQVKNPFEVITNMPVTVSGDTDLGDIEVVPYWWMSNLTTTYTGGVLTATFNVARVSTVGSTRNLQFVAIYLSPTNTPDQLSANSGAAITFNAGTNTGGNVVPAAASNGGAVTIRVDLNSLTTLQKQQLKAFGGNTTVWASIAVKTNGVNDALTSDAIQLQLPF